MATPSAFDDRYGFPASYLNRLYQNTLYQNVDPNASSSIRLQEMALEINRERADIYKERQLQNLTLRMIFVNVGQTLQDILHDLMLFDVSDMSDFVAIFTKGERMLYLGIFLVMVAIILTVGILFFGKWSATPIVVSS